MDYLNIAYLVAGVIAFIFLLAAMGGVAYSQFRKGMATEKADDVANDNQLIQFWKDQVTGFKEVIAEQNAKLDAQAKDFASKLSLVQQDMSRVQGQLIEKEKQLDSYLAILKDKDPATKQFQDLMLKFTNEQSILTKHLVEHLDMIREEVLTSRKIYNDSLEYQKGLPSPALHIEGNITAKK